MWPPAPNQEDNYSFISTGRHSSRVGEWDSLAGRDTVAQGREGCFCLWSWGQFHGTVCTELGLKRRLVPTSIKVGVRNCIERMVWLVEKLWVISLPPWTGLIVEALRPKTKDWALHLIMGQSWEVWVWDWLTKLKECCRGKNLIRECKIDYRVGNFNPWRRQMTSITFPPDQPHSPYKAQLKQHTPLESLEIPWACFLLQL